MRNTIGIQRLVADPGIWGGKLCLRLPFAASANEYIPLDHLWDEAGTFKGDERLSPEDERLCRAFAATKLPHTEEYRVNNRYKTVKILFDENLPHGLVPELMTQISNLTQVYLEGLGGYTDEFIYHRPWYQLEPRSTREARQVQNNKYIIISRDYDLTDLAREQWMRRIACVAQPEDIDFSNVNVVFRVADEALTQVDNAEFYRRHAEKIMRAAFSGQSASYLIGQHGVWPEPGSTLRELVRAVEKNQRIERARIGELSAEELEAGKEGREERKLRRASRGSRPSSNGGDIAGHEFVIA